MDDKIIKNISDYITENPDIFNESEKKGLFYNINNRKKAGISRDKSDSTIDPKTYKEMSGWGGAGSNDFNFEYELNGFEYLGKSYFGKILLSYHTYWSDSDDCAVPEVDDYKFEDLTYYDESREDSVPVTDEAEISALARELITSEDSPLSTHLFEEAQDDYYYHRSDD